MKLLLSWLKPGLRAILVMAILLIIGLTALIVYLPWANASTRNVDTIIEQLNNEIVLGASKEVERLFDSARSARRLIQTTYVNQLIDPSEPAKQESFLLGVLAAHPNLTWVQFGAVNGDFWGAKRETSSQFAFYFRDWNPETKTTTETIRYYDQNLKFIRATPAQIKNPPYLLQTRDWYKAAIAVPNEPAWIVYVYTNRQPGVDNSITLERQGELRGVLAIGIELQQISEYLQALQENRQNEASRNGTTFILDEADHLIASTYPQTIASISLANQPLQLKKLCEAKEPLLQIACQTIPQVRTTDQSGLSYHDAQSGQSYYVSLVPLGGIDTATARDPRKNWRVGTVISKASYLEQIDRNNRFVLGVIFLFIPLTIALAIWGLNQWLVRPLLKITRAARKVEANDFQPEELATVAERGDELGNLADVFQRMAEEIRTREEGLKEQVKALKSEINQTIWQAYHSSDAEFDFKELLDRSRTLRQNRQSNL